MRVSASIRATLAEELRHSPGLALKATYLQGTYWVLFADQWDPKSPWADRRLRLAASHSMNRKGLIDLQRAAEGVSQTGERAGRAGDGRKPASG